MSSLEFKNSFKTGFKFALGVIFAQFVMGLLTMFLLFLGLIGLGLLIKG